MSTFAWGIDTVHAILRINYARKKEFLKYYRARVEVRNWFYLYNVRSSLLLYLINTANRKLRGGYLFNRFRIAPGESSRLTYWVPYDCVSPQIVNSYEVYSAHFRNYFHHDIHCSPGDTILDIGSHIGTFGVPLKRKFPGARVISFEPDQDNFELQLRNIRDNRVGAQFHVENAAVADTTGQEIFITDSSTTGSLDKSRFVLVSKSNRQYAVRAVGINEVFEKYKIDECKLLKLDCEGAEYIILEALNQCHWDKIRNIIVEIHKVDGRAPNDLVALIKSKGFEVRGHSPTTSVEEKKAVFSEMWELFCRRVSS